VRSDVKDNDETLYGLVQMHIEFFPIDGSLRYIVWVRIDTIVDTFGMPVDC
jgi:hypothetical protein